ncbi:uncharacterized protein LOC143034541 isoform X2 [Oratosquilla oratoria]|uniref:uncharacterized protein LOC143034541 isoform X2 n=1 Tax=Oratosquilla oratoria TaxID=337810 RepID=UPI003F7623AB
MTENGLHTVNGTATSTEQNNNGSNSSELRHMSNVLHTNGQKATGQDMRANTNNNVAGESGSCVGGGSSGGSGGAPAGTGAAGSRRGDKGYVDVIRERPIRVTVKVLVPTREHPKFNFVGKLLGPKGNSMKRLQEETMTKMAVLGRGSMRDKQKEEDLRASGDPKYVHLAEDLHVEITAFSAPAEAHARIAYALAEIRRYLVPDNNDDIRKEQMREMEMMGDPQNLSASTSGTTADLPPPLTPPELLAPDVSGAGGAPPPPPPPPGPHLQAIRGGRVPPQARLIAGPHTALPRGYHPPLIRKMPHALPPPVAPPPAKRRVLSILDKAKLALDHSYGFHEDEPPFPCDAPEFCYEDFHDYGGEDYAEIYNGNAYEGTRGSRGVCGWPSGGPSSSAAILRPALVSTSSTAASDRSARCRPTPYARPK